MELRIAQQQRLPLWVHAWQSAALVVAWLAGSALVLPFLVILAEVQPSADIYNAGLVAMIIGYGIATTFYARWLHRRGTVAGAIALYILVALYAMGQIPHLVRIVT
ncbi:MAG TPA: hypothetical protein VF272_00615 [Candidatus Saccharimonadia bacterium]